MTNYRNRTDQCGYKGGNTRDSCRDGTVLTVVEDIGTYVCDKNAQN